MEPFFIHTLLDFKMLSSIFHKTILIYHQHLRRCTATNNVPIIFFFQPYVLIEVAKPTRRALTTAGEKSKMAYKLINYQKQKRFCF